MSDKFLEKLQELISSCSCKSEVIGIQMVVNLWKTKNSNDFQLYFKTRDIDHQLQLKYLEFKYSGNEEQW